MLNRTKRTQNKTKIVHLRLLQARMAQLVAPWPGDPEIRVQTWEGDNLFGTERNNSPSGAN